ncbi:MAG: MBL fold metallo-hydrolase [Planctomycetota bacterium]
MSTTPNGKIHRVCQSGDGSVNSWVMEGQHGLIVVDCQRTPSDAGEIIRLSERLGRTVTAILITHAHPDHTLGLQRLLDAFGSQLRVIASQRTRDLLDHDVYGYVELTRQAVQEQLPAAVPVPTEVIGHREQIEIDGCLIRAFELGPGEAESMTAYEFPEFDAVAAGDLVEHRMIPFVLEHRSGEWLRQLSRAHAMLDASLLLPGHGEPGGRSELIAWQARYLRGLRSAVRRIALASTSPVADTVARAAAAEIEDTYGSLDAVALIPELDVLNASAVYSEVFVDE